jgi:hypothetical protein
MKNRYARNLGLVILVAVTSLCAANADNLVVNGGFENTVVTASQQWDIFDQIVGWQLADGQKIEVQCGVNGWLPAEGKQWIELDSDFDGPGGSLSGEPASSAIFQDLETVPGIKYELTFAFSPRPGVADNQLQIIWDGKPIDLIVSDGAAFKNTNWQYRSYTLGASSKSTRLEFGDLSKPDSFGTFLDDVSVTRCIPEPATLCALAIGGIALLRNRR